MDPDPGLDSNLNINLLFLFQIMSIENCPLSQIPAEIVAGGPSLVIQVIHITGFGTFFAKTNFSFLLYYNPDPAFLKLDLICLLGLIYPKQLTISNFTSNQYLFCFQSFSPYWMLILDIQFNRVAEPKQYLLPKAEAFTPTDRLRFLPVNDKKKYFSPQN